MNDPLTTTTATTLVPSANTATYTTNLPRKRAMITEPAFISLDTTTGARIQGRAASYSDPKDAGYGAFQFTDTDGVTTYVLWGAILRLNVFPLSVPNPVVPPLEKA